MISLRAVRTVAPADPVVSTGDAKVHLRVTGVDDDFMLDGLIAAVTEALELELGRAFVTQTWRVSFSEFCDTLYLPIRPVQSITDVTYYDVDNTEQTADTDLYVGPFLSRDGTYLKLMFGASWPTSYERDDAVSVTYVAGYGDPEDVPMPIRQAVILGAREIYQSLERDPHLRREQIEGLGSREWFVSEATLKVTERAIKSLTAPYRVMVA